MSTPRTIFVFSARRPHQHDNNTLLSPPLRILASVPSHLNNLFRSNRKNDPFIKNALYRNSRSLQPAKEIYEFTNRLQVCRSSVRPAFTAEAISDSISLRRYTFKHVYLRKNYCVLYTTSPFYYTRQTSRGAHSLLALLDECSPRFLEAVTAAFERQ